jgi:hypothetical protein
MLCVVGLGHRARHGKDYVAKRIRKAIIRQTDADCQVLTFAGDLKGAARAVFGMREKNGPLLQTLGTNVFREHVNKDHWLNCLRSQLGDLHAEAPGDQRLVVLIPDMRFPNEMRMIIDEFNGVTVNVERRYVDGGLFVPKDGRDPNHESEIALRGEVFDHYVKATDGDLESLNQQADALADQLISYFDIPRFVCCAHCGAPLSA